MKNNVGKIDKIVRFTAAIIISGIGIYMQSWWGLAALVPLGTALLNFCPLYPIMGINTNKEAK